MISTGVVLFIFLCLSLGIVWCVCPVPWLPHGSSCYLIGNTTAVTFLEAELFCQQHQSHLVTVETKAENVFIKNTLYHRKGLVDYWMGLTDSTTEGVWVWSNTNTTATFTDWIPGSPDSHYGNEDCATFAGFGIYRWNDVNCTYTYMPLCEKSMPSTGTVVG